MSSNTGERVWILAPGAELELRQSLDGYFPPAKLRRAMEDQSFERLTQGEPFFFSHQDGIPTEHKGKRAIFWCPTRSSRRIAERANLRAGQHPEQSVLRMVHDKGFLSKTSLRLPPDHQVLQSIDEWNALTHSEILPWRMKRRFGFAGRGQRTMKHALSPDDRKWIDNGFATDGFTVERHIPHSSVYSIHGLLADQTYLGDLCSFQTDRYGAPLEVTPLETSRLEEEARGQAQIAAESLRNEGYFGPFGLDLLCHEEMLLAIDLNPRFSTGWSSGFGQRRDAMLEAYLDWVFR